MTQDTQNKPDVNGNAKARDSVFNNLFERPEYLLQLYKALHPEDNTSTTDDIKLKKLSHILVDRPYNDLGFLIKDRLLILVEAQSTWSPNIIIRAFLYLASTYKKYFDENKILLYGPKKAKFPKPELYVLYTGEQRNDNPEYHSLKDDFLDGDSNFLEVKAKILYNGDEGDILYQYVTFCKIYTEQLKKNSETAIQETLRICIDRDILKQYLIEHSEEVRTIMGDLFDEARQREYYDRDLRADAEAVGEAKGKAAGLAEGEAKGKAAGLAEGEAKGKAAGLAEGEAKGEAKFVLFKFNKGMTAHEISEDLGLDLERVEEIIADYKKNA